MSFLEFEQSITSTALKAVARHWNDARCDRLMPDWTSIRPSAIAGQLSIVWSYRYDLSTDTFTGRLSGDQIDQIFGKNLRGVPMKDVYPPNEYPRLFARAKRVVGEPAFYRGEGMVFEHAAHFGLGERIMMPLSSDGVTSDGVVGATEYKAVRGNSSDLHAEAEFWFPL